MPSASFDIPIIVEYFPQERLTKRHANAKIYELTLTISIRLICIQRDFIIFVINVSRVAEYCFISQQFYY